MVRRQPGKAAELNASAEARSRERYRRAFLAGIAAAAARAVSILAVFVSLPVTLKYLGVERFGVWMTITSLTALLAFADFGLGNGLMNAVTRCAARQERAELTAYVSAALAALGGLALLGVGFALLGAPHIAWWRLLGVDPHRVSADELSDAMSVFIICLAGGIPATVIQRVQLGLQLGYVASLWQLVASGAGLLALLLAVSLHASLAWLVAASLATPSVVLALSALVFWGYQEPLYRPSLRLARVRHMRELMRSGALFFVIQVGVAAAFASDNVIIAQILGASAVAQYSVASRLFDGVVMISALFMNPLWPAYADAHSRADFGWIKSTLIWSLSITALGTAAGTFLLVVAGRSVVTLWVGKALPYSAALFAACAGWAVIRATGNALAMFLNGLGWIGVQAATALVFAVAAIAAKIFLTRVLGIVGIPLALAGAYLVTVALPYIWHVPRLLARLEVLQPAPER
ncbi:MAG TPA: oligosaccharide flippase family protein [Steroidobacteraceae bacterium]|nr:oligosaccharide flippase family protein [Steroidobacteraceae bacterium]